MIKISNLTENENIKVSQELAGFQVLEHQKDLSVTYPEAMSEYYAQKMNVKKRQVLINLNNDTYVVQAGAMQWQAGKVEATSGLKGVGDFLNKAFKSKVTNESAVKPEYHGTGKLMLEPTYKHILLINVEDWGTMVIDDGLFLACQSSVVQSISARSNLSSAALGGEGLFNLALSGKGVVALESNSPMAELVEVILEDDELKIDGNMAVAWSGSLKFTVEKSGKSLLGSAVSGEGLVNVYRGSGRVLMAVVAK